MKTRQMVDKSFSQHMIYQVFRAITHDIFNDKTWFPTSRCSCEDVFYEVFCIVDKMMFSHTDTESRLAFVEGIGQYEKNYVDEDGYATAQEERQRIVFVILYMASCDTSDDAFGVESVSILLNDYGAMERLRNSGVFTAVPRSSREEP